MTLLVSLGLPAGAYAQASIAGAVKDASGAVLPGVTVEAASPALLEMVQTVVTDATGQYRVENLRPGRYSVTFTRPGFSTVSRAGIELSGSLWRRQGRLVALGRIVPLGTKNERAFYFALTGAIRRFDVQFGEE